MFRLDAGICIGMAHDTSEPSPPSGGYLSCHMPRTLRAQVQELSVLPIIGLTVVAICVSLLVTRQQVTVEAQRNLNRVSHLLGSITKDKRESLLAQTRLLSDMGTVRRAVELKDRSAVRERAKQFIEHSHADSLVISDRAGAVLTVAGESIGAPSTKLSGLIREARRGKTSSSVIVQNGRLYSVAAVPIVGAGKPVGAVAALSLLGDDLAAQLSRASSADVMFVWNGHVVGSSLSDHEWPKVTEAGLMRQRIGHEDYVAFASVFPGSTSDLGASLVALRSYRDMAAPFRTMSTTFIILLMGALGAALLLARAFAESMSRPLVQLVSKAMMIRDGEWPDPIHVVRDDEVGILQSVFNDMSTELKKGQEKILSMVDTDPLTLLDNHRRFKERLDQEVFRACMSNNRLVLVLIDLDKFKDYNEKHGHIAGDEALKKMGELISEVAPDIAFLARYGGEEFAMLLPMGTIEDAELLLERLKEISSGKFMARLTFSAGVADVASGVNSGAGLLLSAEIALSRAKQLGRNRVCRFDRVPGVVCTDDPFQLQQFLQDTTFSTIQALAGAVDAKDPYTQGHSTRVAQYAADLARYVGHPKNFIDLVYKTATLHDVGKIGVPDSILSKNSRLEPEECAIMETHPVLGELIVRKAPQLEAMLPGVRHHHERWDGKGYPDGLSGIQIPLLARVIAVADTFDAMTSDRPYRRALPDDVALSEILRKAGEQFDPELAEAFVKMMRLHTFGSRAA